MLRFSVELYKAAMLAASTEETRYYLNGVFVEPCVYGGVTLTATDGHVLVCIRDLDGSADESAIVIHPAKQETTMAIVSFFPQWNAKTMQLKARVIEDTVHIDLLDTGISLGQQATWNELYLHTRHREYAQRVVDAINSALAEPVPIIEAAE